MRCIILTEQEAAAASGATGDGAALEPMPLIDGNFALPERVLFDPAHVEKIAALAILPRRSVGAGEFETVNID